jgi:hypothetical protein
MGPLGALMTMNADISGRWFEPMSLPERPGSHERAPSRATSSMVVGGVAGMLGGVVALGVADAAGDPLRFTEHVHEALSPAVGLWGCVLVAAGVGAVLGSLFGRLTRRLIPMVPRALFGAIFVPAAWTALYAFVLPRFLPFLVARVAFLPSLLGALAYGLCVALARPRRPRRPRRSKFEEFEDHLEAAEEPARSFPLVRRRT